ncbi:hypothetical protein QTJ16_000016 [Diplocarpon rosae]|uniref:Uncharacterized protein n=1 Tax=Diplocarpon rosae TaxID=946125 RepID=A0AAD9T471_9HELO|nr:hypothetical protein QTJ16_000016 [Diplocarpon rosae]
MSAEKPAGMASGDPTKQITTLFQTVHQAKGDVFPFKQPYMQDLTAIPEERSDSPFKQPKNAPAKAFFPAEFTPDPVFDEFIKSWPEYGTIWAGMHIWYKKWFDATGIFEDDDDLADFIRSLCMSSTLLQMNTSYSVLLNWFKKKNLRDDGLHKYFHEDVIESFAQYVWYARVEGMERELMAGKQAFGSDFSGMGSSREAFEDRMIQLAHDTAANEQAWTLKLYGELEEARTRANYSPISDAEVERRDVLHEDINDAANTQSLSCVSYGKISAGGGGPAGEPSDADKRDRFFYARSAMDGTPEGSKTEAEKCMATSATGDPSGFGSGIGVDHGISYEGVDEDLTEGLRQSLACLLIQTSGDAVDDDGAEGSKEKESKASNSLEKYTQGSLDSGSDFEPNDPHASSTKRDMRPAVSPKGKGKMKET